MPDYFVPLDTTQFTRFHRQLAAKSILINTTLRYVDRQRKMLKRLYPAFSDFYRRYEVPQSLVDELLAEAEQQKLRPKDKAELERTLPLVKNQIKALVARDLWDMSEYFQVMNEENHTVREALELLGE